MRYHDVVDRHEALTQGKCGFCGEPLTLKNHQDRMYVGDVTGQDAYLPKGDILFCEACKTFWPQSSQDQVADEAARALDTRTPRGG